MTIDKTVVAAIFAIGLGSSYASAQTPTAVTTTATTATFTAVVAKIDRAAGTISLTQAMPVKPAAPGTVDTAATTATGDYQVNDATLLNVTAVGATVQATIERVNGQPTVTALK
jgi:Cu/Ag efflux protein CusF